MALITCPDCGNEVSDHAEACPRCGRPTNLVSAEDPAGLFTEEPPKRDPTFLKSLGALLFLGGIAAGVYFLAYFDTSVGVPAIDFLGERVGGGRVNNFGLMQERQNGLIVSGAVVVAGFLLIVFAEKLLKVRL